MNLLDLIVLALAVSAVVGGYRVGFLARVLSWVGLVLGFYVAVRVLPVAIDTLGRGQPSTRLLVAAGVLVFGSFAGQALGLVLGGQLRRFLPFGGFRTADRAAGALAGGLSVAIGLWLLIPALADVSGAPARQVRTSTVARLLDDIAPRPPDTFQALRRLLGNSPFPRVFADLRPSIDAGAPPADSGLPPEVQQRVLQSIVKIEGIACDRLQEGTGFVVGDGVVVTNAHVVAGERTVRVVRPNKRAADARVVVFDKNRDLAVLAVPGLGLPALGLGTASEGDRGAVFGHPGGQPEVRVAPAQITQQVRARGLDLYGREETERDVFVLAANLAPGDSGAPLVDQGGAVVGVAFAVAPDRSGTSYALTRAELDAALRAYQAAPGGRSSTGDCLAA